LHGRGGYLGKNAGRSKTHDKHHDEAVGQKPGFGRQAELGQCQPQYFAQSDEDGRTDERAVDVAKPPEHHHAQHQEGFPELEHVRGDKERPPGEECSGQCADPRGHGKGDDLVGKEVDTRRGGGHGVLANGEPSPPQAWILQPAHDDVDEKDQDDAEVIIWDLPPEGVPPALVYPEQLGEPGHVEGDGGDAGNAQRPAREPDFVGEKEHHQFGKAEGDDGEIVPHQPQGGGTEEHAEKGAVQDGQRHDHPEGKIVVNGEQPRRVGADAVKSHETEVEQTAESRQDVKAHGKDHVDHDEDHHVEDVDIPKRQQRIEQSGCRQEIFERIYCAAHGISVWFAGPRPDQAFSTMDRPKKPEGRKMMTRIMTA